jgi:hypothetical protein
MFAIIVLIVSALLEVLEIIKDINKDYKKKLTKYVLITIKSFVAISLAVLAINTITTQRHDEKVNAKIGNFGKQKDCLIQNPVIVAGKMVMENNAYFGIGVNGLNVNPLNVEQKNKQLSIIAYIRDSKGDMIATIAGRTWEIVNSQGIDYNNDDSAFEIVTLDGRLIFQIQLQTNVIICQGMICSEYGYCVFLDNINGVFYPGKKSDAPQRFVLPERSVTETIFKYPRYKYLGVRNNH